VGDTHASLTHEESMPGFHEDDETDCRPEDDCLAEDEIIDLTEVSETASEAGIQPRRPPHSTTNAQPSPSQLDASTRPRRNSEASHALPKPVSRPPSTAHETHKCPICGKTLETDNDGLNAHVDFCLSRGAILEAQVEASKSFKESSKYKGWAKPESCTKPNAKTSSAQRKNKTTMPSSSKRR